MAKKLVATEYKTVQDDAREAHLLGPYALERPVGAGRIGTDGVLTLPNGTRIEFELKSATKKGITTARDVGPKHFARWRRKHWLIGFFQNGGTDLRMCLYASPAQMEPWIAKIEKSVKLDFDLADLALEVDRSLFESVLIREFKDKEVYTLDEAKAIQKKQYKKTEYEERMDRDGGFSKDRMLEILADRWVYLTKRGATLNNPHIRPKAYEDFVELSIEPRQAHGDLVRAVTQAMANPRREREGTGRH